MCTVGEVVHTLPEGEVVNGVTSLGDEVFVLRADRRYQVEVYDVFTYRLQRRLSLPNCCAVTDIISCDYHHCVYVADPNNMCVYRVEARRGSTKPWAVYDMPAGLSVNKSRYNVLVTCILVRQLKEFSSYGDLLRVLAFPYDVIHPWHTIQLTNGQYVVCHGNECDFLHRVCVLSDDCRHIVHVHGGPRGREIGQLSLPVRLAVDDNERVYVVDVLNRRVTLLSPTLNYIREAVSRDNLKWYPGRLALDTQRRRLFVADNEFEWGRWVSGRVVEYGV